MGGGDGVSALVAAGAPARGQEARAAGKRQRELSKEAVEHTAQEPRELRRKL